MNRQLRTYIERRTIFKLLNQSNKNISQFFYLNLITFIFVDNVWIFMLLMYSNRSLESLFHMNFFRYLTFNLTIYLKIFSVCYGIKIINLLKKIENEYVFEERLIRVVAKTKKIIPLLKAGAIVSLIPCISMIINSFVYILWDKLYKKISPKKQKKLMEEFIGIDAYESYEDLEINKKIIDLSKLVDKVDRSFLGYFWLNLFTIFSTLISFSWFFTSKKGVFEKISSIETEDIPALVIFLILNVICLGVSARTILLINKLLEEGSEAIKENYLGEITKKTWNMRVLLIIDSICRLLFFTIPIVGVASLYWLLNYKNAKYFNKRAVRRRQRAMVNTI